MRRIAPGDREKIAGFAGLRTVGEAIFDADSDQTSESFGRSRRAQVHAVVVVADASSLNKVSPKPPAIPDWLHVVPMMNGCLASRSNSTGPARISVAGDAPLFLVVILSVIPPPLSSITSLSGSTAAPSQGRCAAFNACSTVPSDFHCSHATAISAIVAEAAISVQTGTIHDRPHVLQPFETFDRDAAV